MEAFLVTFGLVVLIGVIVIFGAAIGAVITWWAWNLVLAGLFHLPQVTLLQAFAVNLLVGMIKPVRAAISK